MDDNENKPKILVAGREVDVLDEAFEFIMDEPEYMEHVRKDFDKMVITMPEINFALEAWVTKDQIAAFKNRMAKEKMKGDENG